MEAVAVNSGFLGQPIRLLSHPTKVKGVLAIRLCFRGALPVGKAFPDGAVTFRGPGEGKVRNVFDVVCGKRTRLTFRCEEISREGFHGRRKRRRGP